MLNSFSFLWGHVYTSGMKPICAAFTLNHQVIRIVRHLTFTVHGNSIGIEGSSRRIILETTEKIVVANGIKLGIALEAVDRTLAFNCVGALNVVVIGEENLLGTVKLTTAAD